MKTKLTWLIFLFLMPAVAVKALDKKITTSDGVELFVTVKGEGIPCLYIHGGPGSGGYWLQAFSGDMLEKKFKMIYLDQRGVSRSGSPKNKDFSLARMLKDFEEVRENLHIKKWLVLGHSFGAGIQTSYAAKYPKAVAGLMMINGTVNVGESLKGIIAYTSSRVPADSLKGVTDPNKSLMEKMMICHRALGDEVYKMYYKEKASSDTMIAVMNQISNWNSDFSAQVNNHPEYFADFSSLTKTIKIPVLVFSGNRDFAVGPEHYKLIQFPEQLLVQADCGHLPFVEAEPELETAINQYLSKYFRKGIS